MRKKIHEQLPLTPAPIDHEHARELAEISAILDEMPEILDLVAEDLRIPGTQPDTGRPGLIADLILRAVVVKQMNGFSYEVLAFHLADSRSYRGFCRIGVADDPPSKSALQQNIKRLKPETFSKINVSILALARRDRVEDGSVARFDCTAVETNIHHPTDSTLLLDCVRVFTRLLGRARDLGVPVSFSNHLRRARRRNLGIQDAKRKEKRLKLYRDLLKVTGKVLGDIKSAVDKLRSWHAPDGDFMAVFEAEALAAEMEHYLNLALRVVDQTERRVLRDEAVPANEKVVSIFEPHTDIIVKGGRETEFGHKVVLESGRSGLVFNCEVLDGNPADSTLVEGALARHETMWGAPPKQTAWDGGFASQANLAVLKAAGVKDSAFHKKRGLEISDMAKSTWVYRKLTRFRAGIEGNISFLKRCFGWTRCLWRGFQSFVACVKASVVTANLLVLARHRLA